MYSRTEQIGDILEEREARFLTSEEGGEGSGGERTEERRKERKEKREATIDPVLLD